MPNGSESLLELDGAVARIRFNRSDVLNAIDQAMAEEFRDACQLISESSSIRVVVLSGEGRAFVSGGDLKAFHANFARRWSLRSCPAS